MLTGCASEPADDESCTPLTVVACPCLDGSKATRTCNADGKAYGACECGAGASTGTSGQGGGTSGVLAGAGAGSTAGAGAGTQAAADGGIIQLTDGAVVVPKGEPGMVIAEPNDDAAMLFDQAQLRSYNLVLAPSDLATIDADPAAEKYVQGMIEVDGTSYGPVGIRYKGSAGAFLTPCTASTVPGVNGGKKLGKCSMKVSFDFVDPEARFRGIKKLNFHSMSNDPSMLRERLGYAMFRESGIAAPRAVHARLSINGVLEGVFALVEEVDGRFTRSRFNEGGEGNLYKEIWPIHDGEQPYLAALATNRDESPSAARMLAFKSAIAESAAAASAWLDPEYIATYLAVDRVIINDDGIFHWWCFETGAGSNPGIFGNHNYYWYEAEHADRLWLVPWDLDFTFVGATALVHIPMEWRKPALNCSCAAQTSVPPSCDPLTKRWIEANAAYESAVDAFIAGPFAAANVDAKLNAWTAQLQPVVAETSGLNDAPTTTTWNDAVNTLKSRITQTRTDRGYHYP